MNVAAHSNPLLQTTHQRSVCRLADTTSAGRNVLADVSLGDKAISDDRVLDVGDVNLRHRFEDGLDALAIGVRDGLVRDGARVLALADRGDQLAHALGKPLDWLR